MTFICVLVSETCDNRQCHHRGTCTMVDGKEHCACEHGYYGDQCENSTLIYVILYKFKNSVLYLHLQDCTTLFTLSRHIVCFFL